MIKTVTMAQLPVNEIFRIKKQHIKNGKSRKRICIVSGIHGDELEGQFVCWELIRCINEKLDNLDGIVEVYPAINPLGINAMSRGIPQFDLDMNRIFPGNTEGTFAEYTAAAVVNDLKGADVVIDIHASNIFLREIPQVRINVESEESLVPLAEKLNIDLIWVHSSSTVLESTLAYSLNTIGTPTLVVEMGVGMRITESYGKQLVDGIFNLMKSMGMWKGETSEVRQAVHAGDGNVYFSNADKSGVFLPSAQHWTNLKKGDPIGKIIDPLTGNVEEEIVSPEDGILFTLREYPIVYSGSLIARILGKEKAKEDK